MAAGSVVQDPQRGGQIAPAEFVVANQTNGTLQAGALSQKSRPTWGKVA